MGIPGVTSAERFSLERTRVRMILGRTTPQEPLSNPSVTPPVTHSLGVSNPSNPFPGRRPLTRGRGRRAVARRAYAYLTSSPGRGYGVTRAVCC